jgi:GTP diphosphokinase / guanosine-3',5'-bis(diphosphate) 3'-diphosphatase
MALNKAHDAMIFAKEAHKNQLRKYTGNPYADHLAEVAGIAACAYQFVIHVRLEDFIATCWLHDSVEDTNVTIPDIFYRFGPVVATGVSWLSDLEKGNRAERKRASRERLSRAPGWVQTIKCADLISNTSSIVAHDPKFAVTYLEEKRLLLDVLNNADADLATYAYHLVNIHKA